MSKSSSGQLVRKTRVGISLSDDRRVPIEGTKSLLEVVGLVQKLLVKRTPRIAQIGWHKSAVGSPQAIHSINSFEHLGHAIDQSMLT